MALIYDKEHENIETKLLLEGIFQFYGYDFRDYALSSLKRRIQYIMDKENVRTISELQDKVLHDSACMERFILATTINVTSMFRDPKFYAAFRKKVVPILLARPFVRIWHAGCSTGEEVYSMAILLKEEGLYEKTRIYATDMNEKVLQEAKCGIIPLDVMKENTKNYIEANGKASFSQYYTADRKSVILSGDLQKNVVWAQHNLVTDQSFNEFDIIFCRNVMIYFNKSLHDRVHKLLYDSLAVSGFLGIGNAEALRFTPYGDCYEQPDSSVKLFRKVK